MCEGDPESNFGSRFWTSWRSFFDENNIHDEYSKFIYTSFFFLEPISLLFKPFLSQKHNQTASSHIDRVQSLKDEESVSFAKEYRSAKSIARKIGGEKKEKKRKKKQTKLKLCTKLLLHSFHSSIDP